jgi:hypothetical protein
MWFGCGYRSKSKPNQTNRSPSCEIDEYVFLKLGLLIRRLGAAFRAGLATLLPYLDGGI